MEKIIAEIHHIIKDSNHVLDAETTLQAYFSDLASQLMKEALEALDSELYVPFKAEGWRIANRDSRTITFTFGTVEFMRRRLKKKGEKSFFPLDNICGFNKSERYSTLLQKQVAELVTGSVYRGVAEAVTKLTSFSMSHGTVGNIVKSVGEKQAQWEKQNLEEYEVALPEEQKEVPFLLVEGDGIVIKGKGKRKEEIHRVQIAEGVTTSGKRKKLKNPIFVSSLKSAKDAWEKAAIYLGSHYDLKNTVVISNTDGGSGYRAEDCAMAIGVCKEHIHQVDRYHVHKKIKSRLSWCPEMELPLKKALWSYDWDSIAIVLDTIESKISLEQEKDQKEELRLLAAYLERNWAYLRPLREIESCKGIRGIGSCESNHRPYSYRMKGNGKYWSHDGARAMVSIIEGKKMGTLEKALTEPVRTVPESLAVKLKFAVRNALKKHSGRERTPARQAGIPAMNATCSMGMMKKIFAN